MFNLNDLLERLRFHLGLSPIQKAVKIGKVKDRLLAKEYLTDQELNHHVHIVGASGFGKTVLLTKILKDRIQKGEGCLWLDLKGDREMIQEMTEFARKAGRAQDLKIFSISDRELSGNYNLIAEGNATEIRDKIMGSLIWSEEFYKNEAMSYLLKLLTVLVWLRNTQNEMFDLHSVYRGISSDEYVFSLLAKVPAEQANLKRLLEDCYQYLTRKEMYHNLSGLRSQLESLLLSDFGSYLKESEDGISLFKAVNERQIVFIFLDSRRYGESAKGLARMLIKDLIATSARIDAELPKAKRKHFVCFIDEFADIADESFTAFPDRARSSKMSLVLSHQDLADLRRISPEFCARLMANMSTLYAFLQSNDESANAIAKRAGTVSSWKKTMQISKIGWFSYRTGEGTVREVEEFGEWHPNRIKRLKVGECIVVKKYPHARGYLLKVDEK